jgi:hypothetical protein
MKIKIKSINSFTKSTGISKSILEEEKKLGNDFNKLWNEYVFHRKCWEDMKKYENAFRLTAIDFFYKGVNYKK